VCKTCHAREHGRSGYKRIVADTAPTQEAESTAENLAETGPPASRFFFVWQDQMVFGNETGEPRAPRGPVRELPTNAREGIDWPACTQRAATAMERDSWMTVKSAAEFVSSGLEEGDVLQKEATNWAIFGNAAYRFGSAQ
jgi:hypothetical protein